jgi:Ni/Fe-hydrogenase subunit HybB-like protein
MHQSSLGTMLLIMQDKLHPLWHTQILPILFLNTAIAVGIAMVIFESTITMKVFKRPAETAAQGKLAAGLPWVLGIYFIIRIVDLAAQGRTGLMFDGSTQSIWFWLEMFIGVVIPFFYFLSKKVRSSTPAMFKGSLLVMFGVIFNRFIVSWLGITFPEGSSYVPHIMELMISAGIVAGGIMAFYLLSRFFPVLSEEH